MPTDNLPRGHENGEDTFVATKNLGDGVHVVKALAVDSSGDAAPAGTAADPVTTTAVGGGLALTDASIANATGASQTIAAADATRKALRISNPSASASWWINETGGVAAANAAGCFELPPGARWAPDPAPTNAVTGIAPLNTDLTVVVG